MAPLLLEEERAAEGMTEKGSCPDQPISKKLTTSEGVTLGTKQAEWGRERQLADCSVGCVFHPISCHRIPRNKHTVTSLLFVMPVRMVCTLQCMKPLPDGNSAESPENKGIPNPSLQLRKPILGLRQVL